MFGSLSCTGDRWNPATCGAYTSRHLRKTDCVRLDLYTEKVTAICEVPTCGGNSPNGFKDVGSGNGLRKGQNLPCLAYSFQV